MTEVLPRQNITSLANSAAKTVSKVVMALGRKLIGTVFCVPTFKMSVIDLTCQLQETAKFDDIKNVGKQIVEDTLRVHSGTY